MSHRKKRITTSNVLAGSAAAPADSPRAYLPQRVKVAGEVVLVTLPGKAEVELSCRGRLWRAEVAGDGSSRQAWEAAFHEALDRARADLGRQFGHRMRALRMERAAVARDAEAEQALRDREYDDRAADRAARLGDGWRGD